MVYVSSAPPWIFAALMLGIQFGAPLGMLTWDRWRGSGEPTLGPGPSP